MYETHFGLRERAFRKTPDPRYLYLGEAYEEALAQLQFAVEEVELALLTGEVGSGKTLLTRVLVDRLGERYEVAMILNPRLSPRQFLRTVAVEFGIERPRSQSADLLDQIYARLLELDGAHRPAVIVIDEAHLIPSRATFEEIRLLTNFQLDDRSLVSVVLVGQPELRQRLKRPAYRALAQRLGAQFQLRSMDREEAAAYIAHRLHVAGAPAAIFSPEAVTRLHAAARGLPRVLNHLATQALLEGMSRGSDHIDVELVESALADQELTLASAAADDGGARVPPRRGASPRRSRAGIQSRRNPTRVSRRQKGALR